MNPVKVVRVVSGRVFGRLWLVVLLGSLLKSLEVVTLPK